jgi:hypothetical protein
MMQGREDSGARSAIEQEGRGNTASVMQAGWHHGNSIAVIQAEGYDTSAMTITGNSGTVSLTQK